MIGNEPSLSGEPIPGRAKGRNRTLAEYSLEELIARWEEFFSEMGLESEIIGLTDRYPEERSLKIRFEDLNRFDTDMSIHLLRQPLNVLTAGRRRSGGSSRPPRNPSRSTSGSSASPGTRGSRSGTCARSTSGGSS